MLVCSSPRHTSSSPSSRSIVSVSCSAAWKMEPAPRTLISASRPAAGATRACAPAAPSAAPYPMVPEARACTPAARGVSCVENFTAPPVAEFTPPTNGAAKCDSSAFCVPTVASIMRSSAKALPSSRKDWARQAYIVRGRSTGGSRRDEVSE